MTLEEKLSKAIVDKNWRLIEEIYKDLAKPPVKKRLERSSNVQLLKPEDIGMATTDNDIATANRQETRAAKRGKKREKKRRQTFLVQCVACEKEFESDINVQAFRIRCPECIKSLIRSHGSR